MITWKMIPEIEKAFGFSLYDWQKDYLLDKNPEIPWGQQIRRGNGKTFAYCVKLLLSDGPPIKAELLKYGRYADEIYGTYSRLWFAKYCLEVNDVLIKAGFKTRIEQ